ncbi:MAG: hypothetical protein Satyrvirus1_70 [Satyrvirus sp.]|uniref:UDP-N-acetylglucosamine diphosphorylase n=1 Tax=Satyrvirus sp. TaxID=2487771 RepID=A0A3G5AEG3_9VIRU|nr:MAG: hypothetical protein Satyrvirus1_70 [Satyrvirus sp.]
MDNINLVSVVLAAGRGKRMMSDKPKVLSEINGKPMINIILDNLVKLNPLKIVIVVGYKKEDVIKHLENYPFEKIEFVYQETQLGTGHAVLQTKPVLDGIDCSVLVHFGDNPTIKYESLVKLIKKHAKSKNSIIATHKDELSYTKTGRVIKIGNKIVCICEDEDKNYISDEFLGGVQIHNSNILFDNLNKIQNNNKQNEYYLTDIIEFIAENNIVKSLILPKNELINVNTMYDIDIAKKEFA